MKSLRTYLSESESRYSGPVTGDDFAININGECLLESYVVDVDNNAIVLAADNRMISFLEQYQMLGEEIARYGSVGSSPGTGYATPLGEEEPGDAVLYHGPKKSDIPAYRRKQQGSDWKLTPGDLEKEKERNISGPEGLLALKNKLGMRESIVDMDRILELAGRTTEDANSNDPLLAKSIDDAAVPAMEGAMSEIDITLREIAQTEDFDKIYDLLTSSDPTGVYLQNMYDEVAREYRLHPDDDYEEIVEQLMDRIVDDFGEDELDEAEYQGNNVSLNKPTRGDVKKFKVYVKDPSTGNVKKVNFGHGGTSAKRAGQKTMKIKKSNPARRRSFRARHNCENPGPKTKARYWSCRAW